MRNRKVHYRAIGLVVVFMVATMSPKTGAQQATPPPSGRRSSSASRPTATQPPRNESVNQRELDLEMLSTVGRKDVNSNAPGQRQANQFIADFDRLLQIDTDIIGPLATAASVDYKKLSQAASETNQRAKRIRQTVALPVEDKKGDKPRTEIDASRVQPLLRDLDQAMKSFSANPVFRVNSPNDAELRLAAGRDLESIITLSETLNKIAKALAKSTAQNN